jgi:hypothetical protein
MKILNISILFVVFLNIGIAQSNKSNSIIIHEYLDTARLDKFLGIQTPVEGRHLQRKIDLAFSFFGVTGYNFTPVGADRYYGNGGRFNVSIGIDFYSKKDLDDFQSITLNHGFSLFGSYSLQDHTITSISYYNNKRFRGIYFGFGFNFTKYSTLYRGYYIYPILSNSYVEFSHYAFGVNAQLFLKLGRFSDLGFQFKPTFFRFTTKDMLLLENTTTFNFVTKIRLSGLRIFY